MKSTCRPFLNWYNGKLEMARVYKQLVPYLGFNGIHLAENAASGHYNSLQVSLRAGVKRDLHWAVTRCRAPMTPPLATATATT